MQPDFIIIGAGSAGCALAHRLTGNPGISVLLLEAGPADTHPMIHLPAGFVKVLANPKLTWAFTANSGPRSDSQESWQRGRALGGSSSINGMVYMRGHPQAYDAFGIEEWSWAHMARAFAELESRASARGREAGIGGPLRITTHQYRTALCDAIIRAFESAGIPRVDDINAAAGEGVGYVSATVSSGRRQSAAVAFLDPIRDRRNLRIHTGAHVHRIMFQGTRAVGVEVVDRQGIHTILAAREIILCGGTIMSPALLQASGVGPGRLLQRLNIPLVADRSEVGRNLSDHRILRAQYRVSGGSSNRDVRGARLLMNIVRAYTRRSGILTHAPFWGAALAKTRAELDRPDSQFQFVPMSVEMDGSNVPERRNGFTMLSWLLRPRSRGSIEITSRDGTAPLRIEPNFLSHDDDVRAAADLFELGQRIIAQPSLAAYGASQSWPAGSVRSAEDIADMFVRDGMPGYHACGTCAMSNSETGVVDAKLRVRGIENLRVADLSVLPEIVAGNTNGPAMATGWRAGEIILNDHHFQGEGPPR